MKRIMLAAIGTAVGFMLVAVCSAATTALLRNVWPELGSAAQGAALEVLDAAYAITYMGVGGYVATRVGGRRSGYVLLGIFTALSLATALFHLDSIHSATYQWVIVAGAAMATAAGTRIADRGRHAHSSGGILDGASANATD
jgi:hypothetical protein